MTELVITDFDKRIDRLFKHIRTKNSIMTHKMYEEVSEVRSAICAFKVYGGPKHKQHIFDEVSDVIIASIMVAINNGATTQDLNESLERTMKKIEKRLEK